MLKIAEGQDKIAEGPDNSFVEIEDTFMKKVQHLYYIIIMTMNYKLLLTVQYPVRSHGLITER